MAVALALRAVAALLTGMPSQDGVSYLWMADRIAAGEPRAALGEVFPPLWPLAVGLGLAPTAADPFRVAQALAALSGALAVVPAALCAQRLAGGGGRAVALLVATAPHAVRYGAEGYSEPLFHLLTATALLATARQRPSWAGTWAGLAFLTRPEGLLLALGPVVHHGRRGLRALWPALIAMLGYAAARAAAGHTFDPLPKLALHAARGDTPLDAESGFVLRRLLDNLLALPGAWFEGLQVLGALALLGLVVARRDRALRAPRALLALALVAIVTFLTRRRFIVAWLPLVALFVPAGLAALRPRSRTAVIALALGLGLATALRPSGDDRRAERSVGEHLRTRLPPGRHVIGDLPRLLYYAGERPPEPRHYAPAEIVTAARDDRVAFVVVAARRATTAGVLAGLGAAYVPIALPPELAAAASAAGIEVLARR
ncbi:MAG: hypothetical protein IPM29_13975 [Planctomycetes bacterium]|nr:hypothetical protein [Planctomycetota bacterium]